MKFEANIEFVGQYKNVKIDTMTIFFHRQLSTPALPRIGEFLGINTVASVSIQSINAKVIHVHHGIGEGGIIKHRVDAEVDIGQMEEAPFDSQDEFDSWLENKFEPYIVTLGFKRG